MGYVVHYRTSSSIRTEIEVLASSTSTVITHLTSGAIYTISVEATSEHLSGESEEITLSLCMFHLCIFHMIEACYNIMYFVMQYTPSGWCAGN